LILLKKDGVIMGFEEFGLINFVPFTKVSDFTNFLKDGKLKGRHCTKCDAVYFPPRADCVKCMAPESDMEWMDYSGRGKLLTFTRIHAAPTGFEDEAPYTIGVVDLVEGGRLLAIFEDAPENEDEIILDTDVKIEPKVLGDGRLLYVIKLS
jgi:uncharacterized OB-fold protein